MLDLAIDVAIMALLVAVIVYAILLNRRLKAVRDHKAELQSLLESFGEATQQAEEGVRQLRSSAEQAKSDLGHQIDRAQQLSAELRNMIQQGQEADRAQPARAAGGDRAGRGPGPSGGGPEAPTSGTVASEASRQADGRAAEDPEKLRRLAGAVLAGRAHKEGDGQAPSSGPGQAPAADQGGDNRPAADTDDELGDLRRPAARVPRRSRSAGDSAATGTGSASGQRGSGQRRGGGDDTTQASRAEEALRRQLANRR